MADEVQRVYVNHTGAQGGAFDVTLDFGYQKGDNPPEPQVRVVMSWEHVVALLKLLSETIDVYQEKVGQLPDIERVRIQEGDES